jgi:putative flippase GtrA
LSASKNNLAQFILFTAIGAVGTAGHYATLIMLVELIHLDPTFSSFLGAIVGAVINYLLNYKYTFRSSKPHHIAASKFMLIAAIGAGINTLLMYTFIHIAGIYYLLALIITTLLVLIWNFLLNKMWTFAEK